MPKRSQRRNSCAEPMDCGRPCCVFQLWTHSSHSVRADRPRRLQLLHCDVTQHALAYRPPSLLRCQSFYFRSSSPPKSAHNVKPIKAGKIRFACKVITSKDSPRMKTQTNDFLGWKGATHCFPHPFLIIVIHFSCLGIDFKMRTPVAASLFCWPTKIFFSLDFIVHSPCD